MQLIKLNNYQHFNDYCKILKVSRNLTNNNSIGSIYVLFKRGEFDLNFVFDFQYF